MQQGTRVTRAKGFKAHQQGTVQGKHFSGNFIVLWDGEEYAYICYPENLEVVS